MSSAVEDGAAAEVAAGVENRSSWSAACRWFTPTPNKRTRARRLFLQPGREQFGGDLGDGARIGGRGLEAFLARESGEVGAANLHLYAAGGEILRAHARAGAIGEPQHLGTHARVICQVVEEGLFGADRFFVPLGHHRAVIDARGALAHALRIPPEDRPQHRVRRAAQLPEGVQAGGFDTLAQLAAEARQAPQAQRVQHRPQGVQRDDGEPVGFFQFGCDLRHQLVGRHSHRSGELCRGENALLDAARDAHRVTLEREARGHVEIGFIERQALDHRRVVVKDREDLV